MTNDHLSDWEIEEWILSSNDGSRRAPREDFASDAHKDQTESAAIQNEANQGEANWDESKFSDRLWQHLAACDLCNSRKARLQELLLLYREDSLHQADTVLQSQGAKAISLQAVRQSSLHAWRWGVWKLGLALVLLLAILVPLREQHQRHQQERAQHAAQIAGDNILLEQVDEEVNSSVPHPLESLTNLVVVSEIPNSNQ